LRGALALFAVALLGAPAASAAERHGYIVQLKAAPVSSYTGGTKGIPATSPQATGQRVSRSDAAVKEYRSFLADRQSALLAKIGSPKPTYSYRMAFAGFAADLTADEADTLKHSPQVARVWRDALAQPQASTPTPDELLGGDNGDGAAYLGLTTGLWPRLGGPNHAGEGVIVGDIDTGITPEHPSFADRPGPNHAYRGPAYDPPEVWDGTCQGGEDFPTSSCNNKLIGARYYVDGFGRDDVDPSGFLSPRDDDGHGSHTASTAAGNYGVDPSIQGNDLGVDLISGIAPRAYIAAYKVCWESDTVPAGCSNADSVAAIDDAVADGVDVINYSIGSTSSSLIDPVAIAFLGATDAGVFVASSAGNDGPAPGSVGSPNSVPWLTSVAASSLARTFQADATIHSGSTTLTVSGASVTGALPASPLADAETSGLTGVDPADAELCEPGSLDPAKVAGKVVLCLRGDNARIDKSRNVQLAGGVGMILYNASDAQELVTDTHWVPSVHISFSDGVAVKNLIEPGATAALSAGTATPFEPGGVLAAFSSRGPQTAVPDIAKPDVAAPGVNILAAASPRPADSTELVPGELFQSISGTSMASPHVAGSAALLSQLHPLFTPAEIKSSLMTTANPEKVLKEDGVTPSGPFDRGSGEIDPTTAADPGLVLDVSTDDYLGYLSGQDPTLFAGTPPDPIAATDLNLPSISNSQVPGRLTTTRTFTAVTPVAKRWDVSVNVDGWTATASPRSFTLKPGQQQTVTFTFTKASTTPLNVYRFGEAALVSSGATVRLPVSLKGITLKAPSPVTASTTASSGSKQFTVQSGFAGPLTAQGFGLAAPVVHAGEHIVSTSGSPNLSGTDPGTDLFPVTVPSGSQLFAARLSNVDGGDPNSDLDLFVYRQNPATGAFGLVGVSAGGTALEHVELTFPTAGNYLIAVVGFTTADPDSVYDLTHWVATDPTADNLTPPPAAGMSVTGDPVTASVGQNVPLTLNWAGVDSPGTYMGVITYHQGATPTDANRVGLSLVEITRSGAAATSAPSGDDGASTSAPDRFGVLGATGAFGLKVKSAKVQGRTLVLRVRTAGHPALRVNVKRGSRIVAKGAVAAVRSGTRTVKVRLSHRLQRGTRYSVRVTAVASGSRLARTLRLKVH
jgi:subtilisin family serine protease